MSAISAAMAARSNSAAGAGPTVSSGHLLAASQSPSSAPSPSGSAPYGHAPPPKQPQRLQKRQHGQQWKKKQKGKPLFNRRPQQMELRRHWWRQWWAWPWQRYKCSTTCISAPRRAWSGWQSRPGSAPALGWPGRRRLPSRVSEPWGGLKNLGPSPPPS